VLRHKGNITFTSSALFDIGIRTWREPHIPSELNHARNTEEGRKEGIKEREK
jgi:hypothetical protein